MHEYRILFTGIGRRVELIQAFRRAALTLNIDLKIYGSDMTETAPALAYCDFKRQVVSMKDSRYIDSLVDICRKDSIHLVVPTIDTDLLLLADTKKKFENVNTRVLISSPEMVSICRDKNRTSQFFVDCGLKAPMPVNDFENYTSGFPAFIKPKDGSSSKDAFKVSSIAELDYLTKKIQDYIIQPYIDGTEYTVDIFCDWNGSPITIVPRERVQVRAGEVLKTRIDLDAVIISECEKICSAFRPCGPITVQLIREKDTKEDFFIEINPRFGGGSPLSMKAGARSAEFILRLLEGESVKRVTNIEDGSIYSRFDQSVCITNNMETIKGVIFDLDDTLYPEKSYVRSGFHAVSNYLGHKEYYDRLWESFEREEPAIDVLLKAIGKEKEINACLECYRSHKPNISLYDGVADMLRDLKKHGYKIGLITDGRPEGQRNKIKALQLDNMIDDIIITDELGGVQFRKPCDIAFRIIQRRWRMNPSEIVYVGDNPVKDFQAPCQLGMKSIHFDNKEGLYHHIHYSETDKISNLLELKKVLIPTESEPL